ncbi:hypothetical protein GCM10027612_44230 [Microbispora bryophytorum subsp. camponoti]
MQATLTVTPAQLPEVLLHVAVVRPVFLWGAPGIGKSSLVRLFADSLGLECVTLLGTQLAPEDLIGVPQIVGDRSRFAPPETIARQEPYCLFLDELNASSPEVQKAFYSLILDRRIGTYELPAGSVVIGAGNRATDNALARPMPSALVNRMIHVHLRASADDWLSWAATSAIHPWIVDYLVQRPDHLWSAPPKTEEPFSTPRGWHMLSDAMHSYGERLDDETLGMLAYGTLTAAHASAFRAYVKTVRHAYDLDAVIKGDAGWPRRPRIATCCTSCPRPSGPGWSGSCRSRRSTSRRPAGNSPSGPRICSSSWRGSRSNARSSSSRRATTARRCCRRGSWSRSAATCRAWPRPAAEVTGS